MPKYSSANVSAKGVAPEPIHDYFERQLPSDLFTEWKYNAVIDNIIVLLQQFPPFYISGINIVPESISQSENKCIYSFGTGLVSCKGLVYIHGGYFETAYEGIYVVRASGNDGLLYAVPLSSYSYDNDVANNYCKIGYVCKGNVQYAQQEIHSYLKDLPLRDARYNMLTYFGGWGEYS